MNLLTLQRTMARAVMHPLTHSEHMSKHASNGEPMAEYAARFIKPNDRLTSFERLEIYNRQYWWRLMSSLAEDFPGLQAILGNRRFEALCEAYLVARPSRSFTLRNLGRDLEPWLRPKTIFLTVHRSDYSVYFRRLQPAEYHLLHAMQKGKTLGEAITDTFSKRSKTLQADLAQVTAWFQNWSTLGWFCALPKNPKQ